MKRVIFVRHGATAGNLQRRYIGRTDEPLCPLGREQAAALRGLEADRIVVSPMVRTRQTAELAFPGRSWEVCPELRETDFGIFEGKTAAELEHDAQYRQWVDGGCAGPIPGGEAVADFKDRCSAAFLQAMKDAADDSTTAFVIHGGCIMAILERFARPEREFYAWRLPNGGMLAAELEGSVLTVSVESGGEL